MIDKIGHIDILWNQSKILYNQDRSFSLSLPPPPLPTNACFLRHTHAHVSAPTNTHTHTHTQWDIKRANICHIFVIKVNNPLNPTRTCKTTGSWLSSSHPALNLNPSHFRNSETSFAISIRFFFFLLHLEANDTSAALYPLNPLNLVALRTTLIFCTILKLNWINKN